MMFSLLPGMEQPRQRSDVNSASLFTKFKERSEFLLTGGYLRKISNIKGVTNYVTTVEGYKLLYFMAVVYQHLGSFFPCRKGTGQLSLSGIETDLTNLVFNIPAS